MQHSLKAGALVERVYAWHQGSCHQHLLPKARMCNALSNSAHGFSRVGFLRSMHSLGLSIALHAKIGLLSIVVTCRLQGMWSCLHLLQGMSGRGMMRSGSLWGRAPFACTSTSATSCSTSDVLFKTCITAQAWVLPSLALRPVIFVPTGCWQQLPQALRYGQDIHVHNVEVAFCILQ